MGMLIDKVQLTPLSVIPLDAGNVMHAMRRSSSGFAGFGEAYFSWIGPGFTKGWKRHRKMTLNLVVPVGLVAFAVVDSEVGVGRRYELGPQSYVRLTVPPGLWVAFRGCASYQSLVLNIADIEHDPAEADSSVEAPIVFDWNASAQPSRTGQRITS